MMYRKRIFPFLLLANEKVVKTVNFEDPTYIGDPLNTVSIFNEFRVDELGILDINVTKSKKDINFYLLKKIAEIAEMPISYGGGIKKLSDAQKVFDFGFEKINVNTSLFYDLGVVEKIASIYGSQSICASIDFKLVQNEICIYDYRKEITYHPDFTLRFIERIQNFGVGEILFTNVNGEGLWSNFPYDIFENIMNYVKVPSIALGGIGTRREAQHVLDNGFQAVALSSAFLFKQKNQGVVIHPIT